LPLISRERTVRSKLDPKLYRRPLIGDLADGLMEDYQREGNGERIVKCRVARPLTRTSSFPRPVTKRKFVRLLFNGLFMTTQFEVPVAVPFRTLAW